MELTKIEELVRRRNERNEDKMCRTAEQIIENILAEQSAIKEHEATIVKLRRELQELNVQPINPADVLGS